jgi:hypothetical protein
MQEDYGSYGLNRWVYNRKEEKDGEYEDNYWKTRNVENTSRIPLFADCAWYGGGPFHVDDPPAYPDDRSGPHWSLNNMKRFCLDRHNGTINSVFLDISVRKIGLKELWTLKWHRNYFTAGFWTKAGFSDPEDWPQWMRKFKDY